MEAYGKVVVIMDLGRLADADTGLFDTNHFSSLKKGTSGIDALAPGSMMYLDVFMGRSLFTTAMVCVLFV